MSLITAKKKKIASSKPKLKDFKLRALLELTKAINNNSSIEELLSRFEQILKNELSIGKLVMFSYNQVWSCVLKYGVGAEYNNINVERDLLHIKGISTVSFSSKSLKKSFEIAIPVYHKSTPLAYVLIGDLEDKLEVSPAIKHLPFIQTLTNIIMSAIENKKLAKENIKQAALKRELELASEMQNMLFPSELPNNDKLEVAALYQPHQEVGGDYYDYIKINENEFVFCMADVSGKGVSAALLMANFQANLRALINHTTSLPELVRELNNRVMTSAKGEKFITLFIAKYNIVTRVLHYINAAHNPPLMINGNSVSKLSIGCTGIGMFEELKKVNEGIIIVEKKAVIVCYTDGVVELENKNNKDFGTESLEALIKKHKDKKAKDLNKQIMDSLIAYKGTMPYIDDIALFTCRFF